jgi:hypothetical protein
VHPPSSCGLPLIYGDAHRLYPGEGVIPIDAILSSLHARGFDGVASVEIFRPEYWEQPPADVARTAYDRAAAVSGTGSPQIPQRPADHARFGSNLTITSSAARYCRPPASISSMSRPVMACLSGDLAVPICIRLARAEALD